MKSSTQTSPEKTITIPHELYCQIANALLQLGNFATHAGIIADNLQAFNKTGSSLGVHQNIAMLADLATEADNIGGQWLSAQICEIGDQQS
ncbi:hypothetical protein HMPREF9120_00592 [Neisseria sp. oral taxon 020 str. F0370]|uniref:hypothetical protein n=1 Tax=unclassified Neisseria TaxID=2623750 RepID=UPI0002A1AF40|nr:MULTISPECIES: hypothetical protein [unclassified Neisseria]ASP17715.1 hypothetical protein CGZ77_08140 [Neisseria sp. KEM232]EKY08830.1 hypothetical protein HMPREF9120_00592 [Neisseria sp. oral taxon 020 str. F0370]